MYFISNQLDSNLNLRLSFNISAKQPEIWNANTGEIFDAIIGEYKDGKTNLVLPLAANGSLFIVFRKPAKRFRYNEIFCQGLSSGFQMNDKWQIEFDTAYGGPKEMLVLDSLTDLSKHNNNNIKYYSGTAVYKNTFTLNRFTKAKVQLDKVYNLATVKVNGIDCGTIWTKPYELDISKAVKEGVNTIEIAVTNTWHNRLIGDHLLPENKRTTFTTAPFRLEGKALQPSGLVGDVTILAY